MYLQLAVRAARDAITPSAFSHKQRSNSKKRLAAWTADGTMEAIDNTSQHQ